MTPTTAPSFRAGANARFLLLAMALVAASSTSAFAEGYDGYGDPEDPKTYSIEITPITPQHFADSKSADYTARVVGNSDTSIELQVDAIREDGAAMQVTPATGNNELGFSVKYEHNPHSATTPAEEKPQTVKITAIATNRSNITPRTIQAYVWPWVKASPPSGSVDKTGIYQSGGNWFIEPGENAMFTATVDDIDECRPLTGTITEHDKFEKDGAFEWIGPVETTDYNAQVYWTAPNDDSHLIAFKVNVRDDAIFAEDVDRYSHQYIDSWVVDVFKLDGLTVKNVTAKQQYNAGATAIRVFAHSMGHELAATDTFVPKLKFELIDDETGSTVDTKTENSPWADLTLPGPGRYKFRITNTDHSGEVATSENYIFYDLISITPASSIMGWGPTTVEFEHQAEIEAKKNDLKQRLMQATRQADAANKLAEAVESAERVYGHEFDRQLRHARAGSAAATAWVSHALVVAGAGVDVYELIHAPTEIDELGRKISEAKEQGQQLRDLVNQLRAKPRTKPGDVTLTVVTKPGNLTVKLTLEVTQWRARDPKFPTDSPITLSPSSISTDSSGSGTTTVVATGNIGDVNIKAKIDGGTTEKLATISVTGMTSQEVEAAATTYVEGLRASIQLLILAAGVLLAAVGVLLLAGPLVAVALGLSVGTLFALSSGTLGIISVCVGIMGILAGSAKNRLIESIRQLYPRS